MTEPARKHIVRVQRLLVLVAILLFAVKVLAWYLTASVAILTDALESTVNVIAGLIGLYSVVLSSKPKDKEHPYGHGKVEFLSSAIEGVLISLAGLIIIYEAINNLIHPHQLKQLDAGIWLIGITAVINYLLGLYCVRQGKKAGSPVLIAGGEHLKTDTYSTLGILLGVGLIILTGQNWIDSVAAMVFAFIILFTGYKIIRRSVSGIMDETDAGIVGEIIEVLNANRQVDWIDVHNMRVINYAGFYHIDCHLTVPYYKNVHEAHEIMDSLTGMLSKHFEERVEFFVHVDGCLPTQCTLCSVASCPNRSANFVNRVEWNHDNILSNTKHKLRDDET